MWHGYADILVKRSVVKVRTEDEKKNESGETEDGSDGTEDGSGDPPRKKMRTESVGGDKCSVTFLVLFFSKKTVVDIFMPPKGGI